MDPFQTSVSKNETYVSSTGTDSVYALQSNVRPIRSGDFASKDEAELAVQGKKQQTNVSLASYTKLGGLSVDPWTEEFWLYWHLKLLVPADAYLGGHVHVSHSIFQLIFSLHRYFLSLRLGYRTNDFTSLTMEVIILLPLAGCF